MTFVDVPGYGDTQGHDQSNLDQMIKTIRREVEKIDLIVLCLENDSKFDA